MHPAPDSFHKQRFIKPAKKYPPTEPISIALSKKNIKTPHRIIGTIQVSNYNLVGVKRQLVSINDLMQQKAASMGGNAVIAIQQTDKKPWVKSFDLVRNTLAIKINLFI